MERFAGWPEILAGHIAAARARAFEWGVHDCCVFACDGILAMTGLDPMAPARGRYRDGREAAAILREIGGLGLPEAADYLMAGLGAPAIHPVYAQRGDLVLIDAPVLGGDRDWCLGLIAHDGRVAVAAPAGLSFYPARAAARAWRI